MIIPASTLSGYEETLLLFYCREAMCGVRYHLVTNAIDTQRQISIISQYKLQNMPTEFDGSPPPISVPNIQLELEEPLKSTGDEVTGDKVTGVTEDMKQSDKPSEPVPKEKLNDTSPCHSSNDTATTSSGHEDRGTDDRKERGTDGRKAMEPVSVSQARAELATLVSGRERMEAEQKRLQRKLDELDGQMKEVHEVSNTGTIGHKEMIIA